MGHARKAHREGKVAVSHGGQCVLAKALRLRRSTSLVYKSPTFTPARRPAGIFTMDTKRIILCILLILCTGCSYINAVTFQALQVPQPGVVGSNNLTVRCQYTVSGSETFRNLNLFTGSPGVKVTSFQSDDANPNLPILGASGLASRATAYGSPTLQYLELRLQDTQCEDLGDLYKCEMEYDAQDGTRPTIDKTSTITVEAPPKAPTMAMSPNTENVTEFTIMTFTCSGNVGRPAGTFQWFTFNNDDSSVNNVTEVATQETASLGTGAESCTYTRRSVLTLNVTRREQGKRLVVRCRVYHATQANVVSSQCQDPNTDYCDTSQQIDVQYPVEVSSILVTVTMEEGTGTTLNCNTRGNPLPYLVEWQKEGDNTTLSTSNELPLRQVTLNDTGNYVCTAYNTIGGITRNDSITIFVTVQKTTTPPPTTTPTTTASTTGSGGTGSGQVSKADTDNLAIIIPVVIVAVIIIVIIIVAIIFVRRRKNRKEVEEPPEKPFNNHLGQSAPQPDIVRNPYTIGPGSYDNPNGMKNEDGLTYAELQFDNKPRSRRPLAIDDSHTDYSDVSMPQV